MPFSISLFCHGGPGAVRERSGQEVTAAIAASDGFIFVTPSITRPSAVLKNAIDWVYPEWNRGGRLVGYGSAVGARSKQLRETAIEIQLAPVRSSVHIPVATLWAHFQGAMTRVFSELEACQQHDRRLALRTEALKTARDVLSTHDARSDEIRRRTRHRTNPTIAVQAVSPGKLSSRRSRCFPPPGHVRIRVEACGVCHSDAGTVEGRSHSMAACRVNEAAGRVDALGEGVEGWTVGKRVGWGFSPAAADTLSVPRR